MEITQPRPRVGIRILVAAILLAVFLLPPRIFVLIRNWPAWRLRSLAKDLPKLLITGCYDVAFVAALAAVFLLVLLPVRRIWPRWVVYFMFIAAAVLTLLAGILHVKVIQQLGRPFNYQWLYYSDFLKSVESHQAMMAGLTPKIIAMLASVCAGFAVLAVLGGGWTDQLTARMTPRRQIMASLAVGVFALLYVFVGDFYLRTRQWPYDKLANPIYAFGASVWQVHKAPPLFNMNTPYGDEDFAPVANDAATKPATESADPPRVKNVILFVFESLPAEYVGVYGSRYGVTPELDRWKSHAAVFKNFYAHAPATNKSMVSMLCSTYPWISYQMITQEKPDIPLPSLTSQLSDAGYATGFFYSADLSYQGSGEFIKSRGFDFVQDYHDRKSRQVFTHEQWPFLNGSDDISTTESMTRWIARSREKPFFAMMWTMMTHYPYFTGGKDAELGPKENLFNHYLNALKYGDAAFGQMMRWLEEQNLLDSTLVVVVADHGEAFGRHWQLSHGNKIYEENVHVPFMLINPKLFHGEDRATLGGLVDLAPTVADLLGQPPADTWQGRSLFSPDRCGRVYFFAPWSDYWFGYRTGDTKVLYNASKDYFEVFDLARDPQETHDIACGNNGVVREGKQCLAAWVQYQNRMFARLLKN